jgi:hypothetical protein
MAGEVFICHANQDRTIAEAICAKLEENGIRCWVAPRDVISGEDWDKAITRALDQSRILVLVFSASANESDYCINEVNIAFDNKADIIPFFIDDTIPSGAMQLYLKRKQWLNAQKPPLDPHLIKLVSEVKGHLAQATVREETAAREKARKEEADRIQWESEERKKAAETALAQIKAEETEKAKAKQEAARARQETEEARKASEAAVKARKEAEADRLASKAKKPSKVKAAWFWPGIISLLFGIVFLVLWTVAASLQPSALERHGTFIAQLAVCIPLIILGAVCLSLGLSYGRLGKRGWLWAGGAFTFLGIAFLVLLGVCYDGIDTTSQESLFMVLILIGSITPVVILSIYCFVKGSRTIRITPLSPDVKPNPRKPGSGWLWSGSFFTILGMVLAFWFALYSDKIHFSAQWPKNPLSPLYPQWPFMLMISLPFIITGLFILRHWASSYQQEKPSGDQKSGWWWALPIFMGVVGGIIAWVGNKKTNWRQARNMLTTGILLTLLVPSTLLAFSKTAPSTGTISGHVYQSDGKTPIVNLNIFAINVSTDEKNLGAYTDISGYYAISGLPEGNYRVGTWSSGSGLNYTDEWFDGVLDQNDAKTIIVKARVIITNIDFSLELRVTALTLMSSP